MALLVPTNTPRRHVMGDLVQRHYQLSGNNGDTYVPPQNDIEWVGITPTTAIAVGYTVAGNTITFVSLGAWTANVAVWSRVG